MTESCPHCGQRIRIGQKQLTEAEKAQFNWSGDPNGSPNIIEAQCIKAAAEHYGISDWKAQWDTSLSVSENIDNMRRQGDSPTMREIKHEVR